MLIILETRRSWCYLNNIKHTSQSLLLAKERGEGVRSEIKMKYLFLIIILLYSTYVFAGGNEAKEVIVKYSTEINKASVETGISPRLLASIIYAEHKLNYNLEDEVLDGILAKIGYNSSVGVAQIKVNTAEWIERQVHDKRSVFYLGNKIEDLLPVNSERSKLIKILSDPAKNILFAACYIAMIEKLWYKEFNLFSLEHVKTGIIATLYCLGLVRANGKIRFPHEYAKMNNFGKTAQEFYNSFNLRNIFTQ